MEPLRQIFLEFTSFGAGQSGSSEMDSAKFVKLAKDCKLVGKDLSTTDLDLIFTKVKDKKAKKINFETFVEAVALISQKIGKSTDDVILIIVSAKGPTTGAATVADNVRFHDDKSTFTGVHNHGGPTNIDSHNVDMANQLDRSEGADVRGVKQNATRSSVPSAVPRRSAHEEAPRRASSGIKPTTQGKSSLEGKEGPSAEATATAPPTAGASPRKPSSSTTSPAETQDKSSAKGKQGVAEEAPATASATAAPSPRKPSSMTASASAAPSPRKPSSSTPSPAAVPSESASVGLIGPGAVEAGGSVQDVEQRVLDVFVAFASNVAKASGEMDSTKFVKLMGDSGLIGKALTRTDCDLIFTKACSSSGCVKKINYDAFRKFAIAFLASKLETDEGAVLSKLASVTGVSSSGTVVQASRFHDDKSTYTGSHAAGGPTHADQRVSLESIANRGSADVRGVQESSYKLDTKAVCRPSIDDEDAGRRRASGSIACGAAVVAPTIPNAVAHNASPRRQSRGSVGSPPVGTRDRRKSSLLEAGGAIAGSANKKGGVFDRLCDQKSYTGVYAERFKGEGGRINGDTANDGVAFSGNTNSGGDHTVRDLSQICNRG